MAPDSALLLDESGISKKGEHCVGVARQWNGLLGKVDNCQVYAALSRGRRSTLIDTWLHLPAPWVEDKAHCVAAGVPSAAPCAKTKAVLALEVAHCNRRRRVRLGRVGSGGVGRQGSGIVARADRGLVIKQSGFLLSPLARPL